MCSITKVITPKRDITNEIKKREIKEVNTVHML